jgi:transcriptional regulator with XRE-family HTH domain
MRDLVMTGQGDRGDQGRRGRPLLRTLVGAVLRRTRLDQGRTLAEVARAAKVSMQYLSELERGRKEASSEVLAAVCDALRIDLPDLLAEVGRNLTVAGQRHATVIRIGFGPDQAGPPRRPGPGDIVGLLAA